MPIKRIRHKGLRRFFEEDDASGVDARDVDRIRGRLSRLDVADGPDALRLPQYKLHQLLGDREGTWAITVRANWRITFRFEDGNVTDVDLEDYH